MKEVINLQSEKEQVAIDTPVKTINGVHYILSDAEKAEIAARESQWQVGATARAETQAAQSRRAAYEKESDPLFFLYQRGEATQQQWLDKIAEIKQRYPKGE